jgi:hypothetical protein
MRIWGETLFSFNFSAAFLRVFLNYRRFAAFAVAGSLPKSPRLCVRFLSWAGACACQRDGSLRVNRAQLRETVEGFGLGPEQPLGLDISGA